MPDACLMHAFAIFCNQIDSEGNCPAADYNIIQHPYFSRFGCEAQLMTIGDDQVMTSPK